MTEAGQPNGYGFYIVAYGKGCGSKQYTLYDIN